MLNNKVIMFDNDLKMHIVALNLDKEVFLLQISEDNVSTKKKEIRNLLILIKDVILTSRISDTVHFIEEVNMFDFDNNQNKYLDTAKFNSTKSLRVKDIKDIKDTKNTYITRSEARAIYKLYNMSLIGYSFKTTIENEFIFTPDSLIKILEKNGVL
ncbi:hypothetical protein KO488_04570 [Poseidonibacter lekithochrous]|uniref:hypothetical protein n=1 Tax=Poseidonibacter TaxID=2321187 RepID=UPI001C099E2C|nr:MULTISPECIES: hypothetical protein [Poseidonibacter]MBU3014021.1 hypothetical protein [Poseidonibacter lekithochrous]MDO6827316.1 hypothetical protein [Poseidonibacter sp. 1_MG-2023]